MNEKKSMVVEWIDPLQELPSEDERCLITLKEGAEWAGNIMVRRSVFIGYFYGPGDSDAWWPYFSASGDDEHKYTDEVAAWMPVPEPYMVGADED